MQQNQNIFDKSLYRKRRQFAHIDFLHKIVEERFCERLDSIKRHFDNVLIYGGQGELIASHPKIGKVLQADMVAYSNVDLIYDDESLPFAPNSFDAIFSILHLHHANDLAGALIQMRYALKPDGLLLVAVSGVHSLTELRQCLQQAEVQLGGISPRIAPFMDIRDAGALLQRAGLQLPVVDDEIITLSYENMFALMQELRNSGEANIMLERRKNLTPASLFMKAAEEYQNNFTDGEGRVIATAHLLFLTAWKAHANQQQPSQRGSANASLKDAL
jgi:SAM-dependent methyltransferase